jgi:hypothetical protein
MTGEHIEFVVEFAVILLAPIIHNVYLWKVKRVDKADSAKHQNLFVLLCADHFGGCVAACHPACTCL